MLEEQKSRLLRRDAKLYFFMLMKLVFFKIMDEKQEFLSNFAFEFIVIVHC